VKTPSKNSLIQESTMTTDPQSIATPPGEAQAHLSHAKARALALDDNDEQLQQFIAALGMQRPVSPAQAARLMEEVIKGSMSANIDLLADQMRLDGWEAALSPGETLLQLAARANAYLESGEGVELFNLFSKTFARTTGEMFD
jgi:hypothetical protein